MFYFYLFFRKYRGSAGEASAGLAALRLQHPQQARTQRVRSAHAHFWDNLAADHRRGEHRKKKIQKNPGLEIRSLDFSANHLFCVSKLAIHSFLRANHSLRRSTGLKSDGSNRSWS